jgi:hypothetical protein
MALAEYLLSRGANVNHRSEAALDMGFTALHIAAARHYRSYPEDMVSLLLSAGSEVDARTRSRSETPLAWALVNFRPESRNERQVTRALDCIVKLLELGASLDSVSDGKSIEDHMAERTRTRPALATDEHFVACHKASSPASEPLGAGRRSATRRPIRGERTRSSRAKPSSACARSSLAGARRRPTPFSRRSSPVPMKSSGTSLDSGARV